MTEATRSMLTRRSEAGTPSIDDPVMMGGWVAYGVGARAISSVLYTIVPVLITEMAKSGGVEVAVLLTGVVAAIIPTSVPTLSYSASMLTQFLMALPIAGLADMRGWRLPACHCRAGRCDLFPAQGRYTRLGIYDDAPIRTLVSLLRNWLCGIRERRWRQLLERCAAAATGHGGRGGREARCAAPSDARLRGARKQPRGAADGGGVRPRGGVP